MLTTTQKNYCSIAVAICLSSMLIFGSIFIFRLNNDAREQDMGNAIAMLGQSISTDRGCIACHTMDGSPGVGPTWLGMFGKTETLTDGSTVVVDEAYFRESLRNPAAQVVEGYPNVMIRAFLEEEEIQALIEFAKQLSVPAQ